MNDHLRGSGVGGKIDEEEEPMATSATPTLERLVTLLGMERAEYASTTLIHAAADRIEELCKFVRALEESAKGQNRDVAEAQAERDAARETICRYEEVLAMTREERDAARSSPAAVEAALCRYAYAMRKHATIEERQKRNNLREERARERLTAARRELEALLTRSEPVVHGDKTK